MARCFGGRGQHRESEDMINGRSFLAGEGRSRVALRATSLGSDLIVFIYNENAHIGAVAIGEYDETSQRTSVSVHTRPGHKDDVVAQKAAYAISRSTKAPVCVIAGVHVESITPHEIAGIIANAETAVEQFINSVSAPRHPDDSR